MRKVRLLAVLTVLVAADVGPALGLTADDCAMLAKDYGVVPAVCDQPAEVPLPANEMATGSGEPVIAPADLTLPSSQSIHVDHVFFLGGGTGLDVTATAQLDALAKMMDSPIMQDVCLRLVGHADTAGASAPNLKLSITRAEAVASYLQQRISLPQRLIDVEGAGSSILLAGFAGDAPEQRRVSLLVRKCKEEELALQ